MEIPFEEPAAPVEIPFEEPVAPVEIPVEEPVAPVEIPVEEPVAPPEPVVPKMPEYTPYHSPVPQPDYMAAPSAPVEKKPKRVINMEPEPVFDPHRLFADLDDEPEAAEPPAAPEAFAAPAEIPFEEPAAPEQPAPEVPVEPELPPEAPQQFEDIISYSDESQDDRFTPVPEEPPVPEAPAEPESAADDDEYDLGALDLQQEVVIRPSKTKIFFKILVGLLILLSLIATAAVGAIRLVMNVNTGKSAFGDYYFFAVSNEYANVDIHSGDLVLAKRKVPLDLGERAVYVDPDTRSFSFGKNDASSPDPELYNALVYNLSGIAVREENVLGAVVKTLPQGGTIVRKVLGDFYTYLGICLGAFFVLLLIRVIFLRKKRRYLTVEELAQSQAGKQKKQKPQKEKKAEKEQTQRLHGRRGGVFASQSSEFAEQLHKRCRNLVLLRFAAVGGFCFKLPVGRRFAPALPGFFLTGGFVECRKIHGGFSFLLRAKSRRSVDRRFSIFISASVHKCLPQSSVPHRSG